MFSLSLSLGRLVFIPKETALLKDGRGHSRSKRGENDRGRDNSGCRREFGGRGKPGKSTQDRRASAKYSQQLATNSWHLNTVSGQKNEEDAAGVLKQNETSIRDT